MIETTKLLTTGIGMLMGWIARWVYHRWSNDVDSVLSLTQKEYDALKNKKDRTIYTIVNTKEEKVGFWGWERRRPGWLWVTSIIWIGTAIYLGGVYLSLF